MVMTAAVLFCLGCTLGCWTRVLVLGPTTLLTIIALLARSHGASILTVVVAVAALQAGYLAGLVCREVFLHLVLPMRRRLDASLQPPPL